jgi:hypothetical protein
MRTSRRQRGKKKGRKKKIKRKQKNREKERKEGVSMYICKRERVCVCEKEKK